MDAAEQTLEERNTERVKAIVAQGIPLQPGMFEALRTMVYLEHLLDHAGVLEKAKAMADEKIAELLGHIERAAVEAKLRSGSPVVGMENVAKLYGLPPRG